MLSVRLTQPMVNSMSLTKIQLIFKHGFPKYFETHRLSSQQLEASNAIMNCKTGNLGVHISVCDECGTLNFHNSSCRNRNCPNCQAVLKEIWIDMRSSEMIDARYYHVVFTLPYQLNSLIYCNQALLYNLMHKASAQTLLELSANPKYLGATPGIIQVLHTWGQELNFHPHIHCIVSGAGLTKAKELKTTGKSFFIPAKVLAEKFKGKFLAKLNRLYTEKKLFFSKAVSYLADENEWSSFKDKLYDTQWAPDIRETLNGQGNAIAYLGRYANRIAITNSRIVDVTEKTVTFKAKDYLDNSKMKEVTIPNEEFVRRFLMHVLPKGFQKIRYYGYLNNRFKKSNLKIIFAIQGKQLYKSKLSGLSIPEVLKEVWNYNICQCKHCGSMSMRLLGHSYHMRE